MSEHRPLQQQDHPSPALRTLGDFVDAQRFLGHVFVVRHSSGGGLVTGLGIYVTSDGHNLVDPHDGYSWFTSSDEARAAEVITCLNATITYVEATP